MRVAVLARVTPRRHHWRVEGRVRAPRGSSVKLGDEHVHPDRAEHRHHDAYDYNDGYAYHRVQILPYRGCTSEAVGVNRRTRVLPPRAPVNVCGGILLVVVRYFA